MSTIMGKWAKPDRSEIENDFSNNSIKINLVTVDQYHSQKAVYKILKELSDHFSMAKLANSSKTDKLDFFRTLKNVI